MPEHIFKKHKHFSFSPVLLQQLAVFCHKHKNHSIQALLFNLPICASVKKTSILHLANIHKTIFLSSSKLLFLPDFKNLVKVYSADMLNLLTVLPHLYQTLCSLLGAFI